MMDLKVWKQRREGMMREVQQTRLAQALRDSRKRRDAGQSLSPIWKLRRRTGRLRNPLRPARKTVCDGSRGRVYPAHRPSIHRIVVLAPGRIKAADRKSTRLNSSHAN